MARKTADQRGAEKWRREQDALTSLLRRLQACSSLEEAYLLSQEPLSAREPSKFHGNLAFFVSNLTWPGGAGGEELRAYRTFATRMRAIGKIPAEAAQRLGLNDQGVVP